MANMALMHYGDVDFHLVPLLLTAKLMKISTKK